VKKIVLTEKNLISLINLIIENVNQEQEVIELSSEQFLNLLKRVNYNYQGLKNIAQFKNKRFKITEALNLTGLPIKTLYDIEVDGPLILKRSKIEKIYNVVVGGSLDISDTKISEIPQVHTNRLIYHGSTLAEIERKRKLQIKFDEQEERREENEWDEENTDEESEMAHAVFEFAVNSGHVGKIDTETVKALKQNIESLVEKQIELDKKQDSLDTNDDEWNSKWDEIQEKIDEIENEIKDLESELDDETTDKVDVYNFYPEGRSHYDMKVYLSLDNGFEYVVSTYSNAMSSLEDYYQEWVDNPTDYLSSEFLEGYVDGDQVAEYLEDSFRDSVYDSPESYDVTRFLSKDQETEIWLLEMEKWVYENEGLRVPIMYPTKEIDGKVFDFEDSEGNRFQYVNTSTNPNTSNWVLYKEGQVIPPHQIYDDENTEEHNEERESRISDIDYEIEEIKDNPDGDLDDESVESVVEDMKYDAERNPMSYVNDYGLDSVYFIDTTRILNDLIDNSSFEVLAYYDGNYDEININGTDYVVFRID
jgi:hypothetical protein